MLSVVDEAIEPLQNEIESEHETNEMKNETDYIDTKWVSKKKIIFFLNKVLYCLTRIFYVT